jgi:hypothetical protein
MSTPKPTAANNGVFDIGWLKRKGRDGRDGEQMEETKGTRTRTRTRARTNVNAHRQGVTDHVGE